MLTMFGTHSSTTSERGESASARPVPPPPVKARRGAARCTTAHAATDREHLIDARIFTRSSWKSTWSRPTVCSSQPQPLPGRAQPLPAAPGSVARDAVSTARHATRPPRARSSPVPPQRLGVTAQLRRRVHSGAGRTPAAPRIKSIKLARGPGQHEFSLPAQRNSADGAPCRGRPRSRRAPPLAITHRALCSQYVPTTSAPAVSDPFSHAATPPRTPARSHLRSSA